jgi:uncharacterized protein
VADSARVRGRRRRVAWSKHDPFGAEFVEAEFVAEALSARGVAIGSDPEPYRLDYELDCGPAFVTRRVQVRTRGDGWSRRVELQRTDESGWAVDVDAAGDAPLPDPGRSMRAFDDALDPDLGLSPLFNTMPVLRHDLHVRGGSRDFVMLWISVPDLALHASEQRYTHIATRGSERVVRFESIGDGETFVADVTFDSDGIVIDYPGIATRIR